MARRDDARVARRWSRPQAVEGVSCLDDGAVVDDGGHGLQGIGVMARWDALHGATI